MRIWVRRRLGVVCCPEHSPGATGLPTHTSQCVSRVRVLSAVAATAAAHTLDHSASSELHLYPAIPPDQLIGVGDDLGRAHDHVDGDAHILAA